MRKTAEILGMPVFSIVDGTEVGPVTDIVFDAEKMRAAAMKVASFGSDPAYSVLPFSVIESLGPDAIIIQDRKLMPNAAQREEIQSIMAINVRGKGTRVLNRRGKFIGVVTEIEIDEESGRITSFEVTPTDSQQMIRITPESTLNFTKDILFIDEGRGGLPRGGARTDRPVWLPEPEERKRVPLIDNEPEQAGAPAEEAVPAEAEEPVESSSGDEEPKDLNDIFEEHQATLILGKTAAADLLDDDGNVIIQTGETVTAETIERAKACGKFIPLLMNIDLKSD